MIQRILETGNRAGRSLMELLIAIAIIALLLGMLVPAAFMVLKAAKRLAE